ncbi:hypothetical protein [Methylocapsa sp. S129]|uniref:hypothetical protein n=1 Tax=Methylocapsa sp. S129 TaxID=1641869 RepID=UPI00131AEA12|nr:hypothetical protein [Methylocapsa sp. S129]
MANIAWHAYYFDSLENSSPPVRTEIIESESEDDAAKVATGHMGRCKRFDIAPLVWEPRQSRIILAHDSLAEGSASQRGSLSPLWA